MHLAVTKALLASIITVFNCTGTDSCSQPEQKILSKQSSHLEAALEMQPVELKAATTPEPEVEDPLVRSMTLTPKDTVSLAVPFSSQAPDHNWVDPYDEACEETSVIMVEHYLRGTQLNKETANNEINSLINWQRERGFGVDIGAADTAFHARNFYKRTTHLYYDQDVTEENIKKLLSNGFPVIIPTAGKTLNNPNFQNGGPPYHMIVLTGYDSVNFFAHDPGTQFGSNFKYSYQTIMDAIHDWTGEKATTDQGRRAMLVITK